MKINYGINRRVPDAKRKKLEHQNHTMEMGGGNAEWEDLDFHQKIREAIFRKHPGWALTGYAWADMPKPTMDVEDQIVCLHSDLIYIEDETDGVLTDHDRRSLGHQIQQLHDSLPMDDGLRTILHPHCSGEMTSEQRVAIIDALRGAM